MLSGKKILIWSLLAAVYLFFTGLAAGGEPTERKVFHVVLSGMINEASAQWVRDGLQQSIEEGADMVILEMDTPGGELRATQNLSDFIFKDVDIEVVAYVNTKAYSGGTMVALACDSIYMDERVGMIGDVAPVTPTGEMLPEKVQTVIRAAMANYARGNGYPVALVEAMVTPEYTVYRLRLAEDDEGHYRFERSVEIESWSEEKQNRIVERDLIVAAGDLLTISAPEAVEYGLAADAVTSRLHLFDELGVEERQVERIYLTWTQRVLTLLNTLSPLFLIGGLILIYMELNEPGLGLPGLAGVACFATFFLIKYSLHYAGLFELSLFATGVALLMLELFIIPGFGFAGAGGIFLIFSSLVLMLQQFRMPSSPAEWDAFQFNLLEVTGVFLAVIVGLLLMIRYMGKLPFFNKIIRTETLGNTTVYGDSGSGAAVAAGGGGGGGGMRVSGMIGEEGITITPLHPSGKAEFGDQQYDVTAEGEYVEKGTRVEVIDARGRRLVVRRTAG